MLNDFYHMLDPVAISAGPITIYWYGLAYVVGALLAAVVMYRTQRRWGFNITIDDLTSVVVGVVFGLIIGARLFYVVFYGDGYYWAHPLEIFATNEGGMSFHGGLVGGIIGGVLVCRMYKLDASTLPLSVLRWPYVWAVVPTLSTESCGASRPICHGAWSLAGLRAICRVTPPSSTRHFLRASCSFAFCRCSAAKSRYCPKVRLWACL